MLYLTHLNLNQNELQNVVIQNLATDPQSPKAGQLWFNTASSLFKYYDGTSIQVFESAAALAATLADYQAKINTVGILKGAGSGSITAAEAGTDYGYPELKSAGAPTTSTAGEVGQHYFDTTNKVEYICSAKISDGEETPTYTYTWTRITVDISGKQDTITASGILKSNGSGTITAAQAGTDYGYPLISGSGAPTTSTVGAVNQKYYDTTSNTEYICTAVSGSTYTWVPTVTGTANRALVTDANGRVVASDITATELGYLDGVTSNIQTQLDNIPKLHYLDGVECTVADTDKDDQTKINAAAITAITAEYSSPSKYDAVNVLIKFTPSDTFKNGQYMYNGTIWVFQYYVTTGIQLANGTTAGLIQEADSNSDLTLTAGVATVNKATQLRTSRDISIEGDYNDGTDKTDGITATAAAFDGTGAATIKVFAIKTEMLKGQVPVSKGGTGKSSITEGNVLVGNSSGGFDELGIDEVVTAGSDNLVTSDAVATAIGGGNVAHKYTEANPALTASSGSAAWTVTHNLNTRDVVVTIRNATTYEQVVADVVMTSANVVTININTASNISAGTYQVTVIG